MGEVVLAACSDGLLGTDLRTSAAVATFDDCAPQARAYGILGSSSSHVFAANSQKALWFVWGWGERRPKYRGTLPEKMSAMTFTADAALCFGGARSGSIYVWLTSTGKLLRCWPAHCREVTQLAVSQDQSFLVSGSSDATVHLYSLADIFADRSPKPLHSWAGHSLPVTSVAFLPGTGLQQAVATASLDQSVRLWDVGTGQPLQTRNYSSPVNCISVGAGGSTILCACKNGELRSFNPSSAPGQEDGMMTGHTGSVSSCSLNIDGSFAVSSSEVDCVRIWELRTRQCISQAHMGRNLAVSSVQIVRRATHPQPLPLLQPLQKLLTAAEDIADVPVPCAGNSEVLQRELQTIAEPKAFIDRTIWSRACSAGRDLAGAAEVAERLAAAEASQARWAAVAAELHAQLVEIGVDAQATRLPVRSAPKKPPVVQQEDKAPRKAIRLKPRKIKEQVAEPKTPQAPVAASSRGSLSEPAASAARAKRTEAATAVASAAAASVLKNSAAKVARRSQDSQKLEEAVGAAWGDGEDPVTAAIKAAEHKKRRKDDAPEQPASANAPADSGSKNQAAVSKDRQQKHASLEESDPPGWSSTTGGVASLEESQSKKKRRRPRA